MNGDWARAVALSYRQLADDDRWPPRKVALYAAAAQYEGIAARMDRVGALLTNDGKARA